MTVGENIKRIRKEKKMTQKELGVKLGGISQQQIGQWENGDKNPKFETLKKIAGALKVSINDLISDSFDLTLQISKESIVSDYNGIESLVAHKIFTPTERKTILDEITEHKAVLEKMDDVDKMEQYSERTHIELSHAVLKMILDEFKEYDVSNIVIILSCFLSLREHEQNAIIELLLNYCYPED